MKNVIVISDTKLRELKAEFGSKVVYHDFSFKFLNVVAISCGGSIATEDDLYLSESDASKVLRCIVNED